ncbi:MAG: hypothetical protein ABIG30_03910 [Candidatus Aenigmatarchaeota archaeon]
MFKMTDAFMIVICIIAFIGFIVVNIRLFADYNINVVIDEEARMRAEIHEALLSAPGLTVRYSVFNKSVIDELHEETLIDFKSIEPVRHCDYSYSVVFTVKETNENIIKRGFGYLGIGSELLDELDPDKHTLPPSQQEMIDERAETIFTSVQYPDGTILPAALRVRIYNDMLTRITCAVERAIIFDSEQEVAIPFPAYDASYPARFSLYQNANEEMCLGDENGKHFCRSTLGILLQSSLNTDDSEGMYVKIAKASDKSVSASLIRKTVPKSDTAQENGKIE